MLEASGVDLARFQPANMGLQVHWSAAMQRHFGSAVKGVAIHAGPQIARGEWVITSTGIEGEYQPGSAKRVLRNKLGIQRKTEMDKIEADALIATQARYLGWITPEV